VARPWLILRIDGVLPSRGGARRYHLFGALIRRTGARTAGISAIGDVSRALGSRWRFRRPRPFVASPDLVRQSIIEAIRRQGRPLAVDIHDDPIALASAVGLPVPQEARRRIRAAWESNIGTFPILIVPTRTLAEFCGFEPDRTLIAPNGTNTEHIRPFPMPDDPAVGLASGAGPGRGIETLIEASRMVRQEVPGLRLLLWLVGTGADSERYLEDLRHKLAEEAWIEVSTVPYASFPQALARAAVLCIPHPRNAYFDLALPIKLADYMAAGRPVVVTPRTETARVVRNHRSGVVTEGDRAEDLAKALSEILADREWALRLGANGRKAAEEHLDWQVIGSHLADELLQRISR
jgi:glycosyltransferase involved in cell wall biosynthesis